ncbi:transcription factor KUA1-like [Lycium barbarum]|uniref:transcription factor KUA1-like n=1 Tax=Lycium barbarum TaxID=112863 RepID=UPI00293F6545|nr:transcription factor KUA1-like [Lycium barbarum]
MGRKCSHCGITGHNSRTCKTHKTKNDEKSIGMKLFGVKLEIPPPSMKKSFSVGCLPNSSKISSSTDGIMASNYCDMFTEEKQDYKVSNVYLSDVLVGRTSYKKKGVPWTEEEHGIFLVGLEKLGKGDWRGISRNFVTTRTPTQVASHAQKYFLRQNSLNRKRRRRSLFDKVGMDKSTILLFDKRVVKTNGATSISCEKTPDDETNISMINFSTTSSNKDSKSSSQQYSNMPATLVDLSFINSSTFTSDPISIQDPPKPDLELTLAAPRPLNIQRRKPGGLLAGSTITVV